MTIETLAYLIIGSTIWLSIAIAGVGIGLEDKIDRLLEIERHKKIREAQ